LKPIDLSKGNHKVMYEPPNRGRKTHAALNRGAGGNDPTSIEERYPSFSVYAAMVKNAVEDMVTKQLMLWEDAQRAMDRLLRAGQATGAVRIDATSK
jgi:hypothetical protein